MKNCRKKIIFNEMFIKCEINQKNFNCWNVFLKNDVKFFKDLSYRYFLHYKKCVYLVFLIKSKF